MNGLCSRLHLKLWLAVVGAVVLLSLLMGWAWRLTREERSPPVRELVLRDAAGQELGRARSQAPLRPGPGHSHSHSHSIELQTRDGERLTVELSRLSPQGAQHGTPPGPSRGSAWPGPWPVPSFLWLVAVVTLAVALGPDPSSGG